MKENVISFFPHVIKSCLSNKQESFIMFILSVFNNLFKIIKTKIDKKKFKQFMSLLTYLCYSKFLELHKYEVYYLDSKK